MREHFVGKIVAWPNQDDEDCPLNLQFHGCGEIMDVLEVGKIIQPYLLVKKLPARDYDEPPFTFVLNLLTPDLQFFDSVEAYETWRKFALAGPAEVVKLVRK